MRGAALRLSGRCASSFPRSERPAPAAAKCTIAGVGPRNPDLRQLRGTPAAHAKFARLRARGCAVFNCANFAGGNAARGAIPHLIQLAAAKFAKLGARGCAGLNFAGNNAALWWELPPPQLTRAAREVGGPGPLRLDLRGEQRCPWLELPPPLQLAAAKFAKLWGTGPRRLESPDTALPVRLYAGHSAACAGSSPPAGGRNVRDVAGAGLRRPELHELRGTQRFLCWELSSSWRPRNSQSWGRGAAQA